MTFTPGERYPMTKEQATTIMRAGWPICSGEPDLSRGRRFIKAPAEWEFWTTDGRRVHFAYEHGTSIVSQGKKPDPNRPEPL